MLKMLIMLRVTTLAVLTTLLSKSGESASSITPEEHGDSPRPDPATPTPSPWLPYLAVLALAIIMALFVALYAWANREEIWRILSQAPT